MTASTSVSQIFITIKLGTRKRRVLLTPVCNLPVNQPPRVMVVELVHKGLRIDFGITYNFSLDVATAKLYGNATAALRNVEPCKRTMRTFHMPDIAVVGYVIAGTRSNIKTGGDHNGTIAPRHR